MQCEDITLKERRIHGTELFPCGLYQRKEDDPLTAMQYHWHDEIEIIYFESGKASIRIGTEIYDLTEEIFFFVNSGEPHMLTWEIPCRESALVLDSRSFCTEQYSNTGLKIGYLIANGNVVLPRMLRQGSQCFEKIKQQYKDIVSEFVELGYSDLSTGQILIKDKGAQNIIYGSYKKILGYLSVGNHLQPKFEDHNYEIIKKVVEHIWKYYTKRLYVSDLAKIANMNEQYFCRFFKKYLGKTPMAYINTYRLQQAALLLETTDIPITTLCLECGFNNLGHFFDKFKSLYGITPLQFRKGCTTKSQNRI